MKKTFINLTVSLVAAFIFYGGSGVNIVSFCCNDCRSAGILEVTERGCCDIHQHANHACKGSTCCHKEKQEKESNSNCCNLTRVDFEWPSLTTPIIHIEPIVCELLSISIPDFSNKIFLALDDIDYFQSNAPPLLSPRNYLLKLTLLLI